MVAGEKKEEGHGDENGEFDSSHIAMKRWAEFERDRRFKQNNEASPAAILSNLVATASSVRARTAIPPAAAMIRTRVLFGRMSNAPSVGGPGGSITVQGTTLLSSCCPLLLPLLLDPVLNLHPDMPHVLEPGTIALRRVPRL